MVIRQRRVIEQRKLAARKRVRPHHNV
jgi:hypothetical protein